MKKIFWLTTLVCLISCQKKVNQNAKSFLESIDKVKLYSYPSRIMWDTINGKSNERIKFEKGTLIFDKTKVIDSLILTDEQRNKIFNILLDTKWENKGMQAACYEPRHLFSFYKENKIVGYYEVCLECGGWDCNKELDTLPMFCIEKGEVMKEIFKSFKLKYIEE